MMMWGLKVRFTSCLFALLLPLLLTTGARADSSKAHDAEQAHQLTERAKELARAGEITRARPLFRRAYELEQTFKTAANLGTAELKTALYRDAAAHLSEALQKLPAEYEDARPMLEDKLTRAKSHVLTLTITAEPAGAAILIDDEGVGEAPMSEPVFVSAGLHNVTVRLDGYLPATQTLDATAGATMTLPVTLTPVTLTAVTPAATSTPINADHTGGEAGDDVRTGVGIGGLALGAAGIAVGVGLFFAADAEEGAAESLRAEISTADATATNPCGDGALLATQCAELQDAQGASKALRGGGVAAIMAGGAFAVAGLIVLLTGPTSSHVEAAPLVAPGHVGGQLRLRF